MSASIKVGLLGGVILFIWGMVSWMVMPYHKAVIHSFSNEAVIVSALQEATPKAGVYVVPRNLETMKKGDTFAFMSVRPEGLSVGMGQMFAVSLVGNMLLALMVAVVVNQTRTPRYTRRWLLIIFMGTFAAIAAYLPLWNWWGFPIDYVIAMLLDSIIGWAIAGGVMARFINGS